MNEEFNNVIVSTAGWTLAHSFWQGVVVAALLLAGRRILRSHSSRTHYLLGCTALFGMAVLVILTATMEWKDFTADRPIAVTDTNQVSQIAVTPRGKGENSTGKPTVERVSLPHLPHLTTVERLILRIEPYLPVVVTVWVGGVVWVVLLQAVGVGMIWRLVMTATPIGADEAEQFGRIAGQFGIRLSLRFLVTDRLQAPITLGWLKPAIIMPISLAIDMPPNAVEALIAHELAHIRRFDFVVNTLQIVLETLLFYHPCVWWMSSVVRNEREKCCDAEASRICGNNKVYASALVALTDVIASRPARRFALGAMGGVLLDRVRALASPAPVRHSPFSALGVMGFCLICSALIGAASIDKAVKLRELTHVGRMHESVAVFETLGVTRSDAGFSAALAKALNAMQAKTLSAEDVVALASSFGGGVDPDTVWHDFERIRRPGYYPTIPNEFPSNWPWGDAGSQRRLARAVWRQAKRTPAGLGRQTLGRTALAVAAMRRETTGIRTVLSIVTDVEFGSVCGFDDATVGHLRKYASASSDLIGRAFVALQREAEGKTTVLSRVLDFDRQTVDLCRPRLPELDFVDTELRLTKFGRPSEASPAILFSVFTPQAPPLPRRMDPTGEALSQAGADQGRKR